MEKPDFSKVKVRKLDPNDPEIKRLIAKTKEDQKKAFARLKIDYSKLENEYITI